MGSTYLGRPCKPWLRTHRDTWRVNESPREAREHFEGWVRFLTLLNLFFFVFPLRNPRFLEASVHVNSSKKP